MAFVIGEACIDVLDRSCVDVCPVDCIYEGTRKLYINPNECIDCRACESVCPVDAISSVDEAPDDWKTFVDGESEFFYQPLPDRDEALGDPGGAYRVGVIGVDIPLVTDFVVKQ